MATHSAVDPAPVSRAAAFTAGAVAAWASLCLLELGWVPPLRHAWGYNFWQYLPPLASPLLAAAGLALCVPRARGVLITTASAVADRVGRLPAAAAWPAAFVALTALFWLLREQQVLGDSYLLLAAVREGYAYIFPELGATAIAYGAFHLLHPLGLDVLQVAQLTSCVFGAVTALVLVRACAGLGDGRPGIGTALAALMLSAGLLRVFAGHVEVYPATLMAASFYLWAAIAHLDGRVGLGVPAIALGATIAMHGATLFLVPSLVALPWLTGRPIGLAGWLREAMRATTIAALPGALFLAAAFAIGPESDFERLVTKILEVLGMSDAPTATNWWVRFGDGGPRPELGIDYAFLSFAHLKYLVNAYHVLAPAGVALVAATLVLAPARFLAPKALFLVAAAAPGIAYSMLLRPFWGPFDWDLFAAPAFFLLALAAQLVASLPSRRDFAHVTTLLIGLQLVFVGGPFVSMGAHTAREAGPFVHGAFYSEIGKPGDPPHGRIAPWL